MQKEEINVFISSFKQWKTGVWFKTTKKAQNSMQIAPQENQVTVLDSLNVLKLSPMVNFSVSTTVENNIYIKSLQ